MKLSLNKAAQHYRISKSTLSEALNTGRLSASKDDRGRWQIEPSEMDRVFPLNGHEQSPSRSPNPSKSNGQNGLEADLEALRQQLDAVNLEREREREQLTDQIADLRRRLDGETEERRKLTALLTDQRAEGAAPERRGLFARLMG